jgi:branched-chain amino acid transport system substrate-binding protein
MKHIKLTAAPRGPIKLDSYGNPIENVYICRVEKVNGKLQQTVIDTIKNVSQFWNEKPEDVMARPPFSADYPPCNFCSEK